MKKILTILIILAFASCTKEECHQCKTITTTRTTGQPTVTARGEYNHCGDKKEIVGTITSTATVGNVTSTITSVTTCN